MPDYGGKLFNATAAICGLIIGFLIMTAIYQAFKVHENKDKIHYPVNFGGASK